MNEHRYYLSAEHLVREQSILPHADSVHNIGDEKATVEPCMYCPSSIGIRPRRYRCSHPR